MLDVFQSNKHQAPTNLLFFVVVSRFSCDSNLFPFFLLVAMNTCCSKVIHTNAHLLTRFRIKSLLRTKKDKTPTKKGKKAIYQNKTE